jgi:hypothetical protein
MFHRRRTKQCDTETRVVAAPPSRYQLYHYRAQSPDEVASIRDQLRTSAQPPDVSFARVDVVEFAGGVAVLDTPADALLRDWRAVQPGDRLIYGAIASASSGAALDDARLGRLVEALGSVSSMDPADPTSALETLPNVPPALAVPGTDGIVFLVTHVTPKPVTARVALFVASNATDTVAVIAPQRIKLQHDVLTFDDAALRADSATKAVLDEIAAIEHAGATPLEAVTVLLQTPNAPVPEDQQRLDGLVTAFAETIPPIVDVTRLGAPPEVQQMTTDVQRQLLTENGVTVDAVVLLLLRPVVVIG